MNPAVATPRSGLRVLVASDSGAMLTRLSRGLARQERIVVAGTASTARRARDLIVEIEPDLLLCGLSPQPAAVLLAALMRYRPMPVVCLLEASDSGEKQKAALLNLGAADVLTVPGSDSDFDSFARTLAASLHRYDPAAGQPSSTMIAIGASTGGTEAIEQVFRTLPRNSPGVVVAQHIPAKFSRSFAGRLHDVSQLEVREAVHGDIVCDGLALIAPGDYHMRVLGREGTYRIVLDQTAKVWHQRPSVDVLFQSVAACARGQAVGVLLTGMGRDGAAGLKQLKEAGCWTIAQDEASSVVFGMPGAAVAAGAACQVVPLQHIAGSIAIAVRRLKGGPEPARVPAVTSLKQST